MSGWQREDFILRQIRAVAAMLARIVGLRMSGQSEEARAELERSYDALLGSQAEWVRRVDPATAAMLLDSAERILAFAQLLHEEAAQEPERERRGLLEARAAALAEEAARRAPENEEIRRFLQEIPPAGG
jgi:hypothetical protein